MKKSAIIALIITIVVVSPCIVGYVVPTGEVLDQSYKSTDTINITDAISKDSIPIYGDYKGPDNNFYATSTQNEYVPFSGYFRPVVKSSVESPYPNYINSDIRHETMGAGYVPVCHPGAAYSLYDVPNGFNWEAANASGDVVRVYEDGRIDLFNSTSGKVRPDVGPVKLVTSKAGTYSFEVRDYKIDGYTDPSVGWYVPDYHVDNKNIWTNGQNNKTIDILMTSNQYSSFDQKITFTLYFDEGEVAEPETFSINKYLYDWKVDGYYDLGSSKAYEYILVQIDLDRHEFRVSGLIGVTDFSDPSYLFKTGKTVTIPINQTIQSVYGLKISGKDTNYDNTSFAIVNTTIANGFAYGIKDETVNVNDWVSDDYMFNLSNVAVYGSKIIIGNKEFYSENGKIRLNGELFPISGLEITGIKGGDDYGTYLNKVRISDYTSVITLSGNWMTNVLVSDLESYTVKHFDWTPGGFGLDMQGFCSVGLLASLGAFIVVGLIGRRDGGNMAVALITSAVSGIVYLILLM